MSIDPLFLAIDLGGSRVRVAVTDASLGLRGRQEEATALAEGPEGVAGQIGRMAIQALNAASENRAALAAAVASPGPLDTRLGIVYGAPNMIGWEEVPLRDLLQAALGVPVTLMNDANAAALGEYHLGCGQGTRNFVYLTVSTGVGGGVIVDGSLLDGVSGMAGELGHMSIDRHGPRCNCGNIGCLESIASGTAIGARFQRGLDEGRKSVATDWLGSRKATARDVAQAAERKDPFAQEVFQDAAEALGCGVVNCIHIFNPEVVALGGGVTRAGALLFEPMLRVVDRHAFRVTRPAVRVLPAALAEDVGLAGAALVAVRQA